MIYIDNPVRKVYNIDFDGTLTDGSSYEDLVPNKAMINKVRELYYSGNIIIIWSARLWESAKDIAGWCIMNNIPFHGLMLGKGGTDCYVDDKNVTINDFLTKEKMENKSAEDYKMSIGVSDVLNKECNYDESNYKKEKKNEAIHIPM